MHHICVFTKTALHTLCEFSHEEIMWMSKNTRMGLPFLLHRPLSDPHHLSAPEPDEFDVHTPKGRTQCWVSHRRPLEQLMLSTGSEQEVMIHNTLYKGVKLARGLWMYQKRKWILIYACCLPLATLDLKRVSPLLTGAVRHFLPVHVHARWNWGRKEKKKKITSYGPG